MTQPRLSIRDAQPGDTPAIQRIVSTVLAEFRLPFNLNTTDADLRDVAGSYVARGGAFRVLVDGENEVVGCGGLFQKSDDEAELRKMYFMPAVRGLGYGHALLDNLIQFARARGYKRVVLESASQLTTAIGMYQRYGFTDIGPATKTTRCDVRMGMDVQTRDQGPETRDRG